MSEIVLEQVTKRYGRVTAVEGMSFRAEKGRFVVLLGPSGCGKSTLLRLIAGLEDVSAGRILIEGLFFSSRGRHTRWPRDWSSDVCSSDLPLTRLVPVVLVTALQNS